MAKAPAKQTAVRRTAKEAVPQQSAATEETVVQETLPDTPIGETETIADAETVTQVIETQEALEQIDGTEIAPEQVTEAMEATSTIYKLIMADMAHYIASMGPTSPQSEASGASHQVLLFRNLQRVFRLGDDEFVKCLNEILAMFGNANNLALQKELPFRFIPNVALTKDQRQLFVRLLQLLQTASNPVLRSAVAARTNLAEISRLMSDERSSQRLTAFFSK